MHVRLGFIVINENKTVGKRHRDSVATPAHTGYHVTVVITGAPPSLEFSLAKGHRSLRTTP